MRTTLHAYKNEGLVLASLFATWPVFTWYAHRMLDGSDDKFGLLALITALFLVFSRQRDRRVQTLSVTPVLPLMLVYIASLFYLPAMLRAAIAVTLIGVLLSRLYFAKTLHLGLWGLLILALPVMASVQFYLGYPLRWLVGFFAQKLLLLNGFTVIHTDAILHWSGGSVSIDAPCSGIKMLWFGFYLCFVLACAYRLRLARLAALCTATGAIIIGANILRATALFYLESGVLSMPPWSHDGVGMTMYLVGAVAIVTCANRLCPVRPTCAD